MMQNTYQTTSATVPRAKNKLEARSFESGRGTSAVLEAIKELYTSVDIEVLSNTAMAELTNLVTKEGKEKLIGKIFSESMHVSTFVNWNIFLLSRPARYGASSMAEAMSLNFRQEDSEVIERLRLNRPGDSSVETEIEDHIDRIKIAADLVINNISNERFVLHESPEDYEIRFTLGSKPNILGQLASFCGRTSHPSTIEASATALGKTNPSLFAEMEKEAGQVLANIEKILGTSYTTKKARGVVPLGYDFGILFSTSNDNSGEFGVISRSTSENTKKRYSKAWELGVEVNYRGNAMLTTNIAKLSALDIVVLPSLRISRELMAYLTQCKDSSKIKLSTVHGWAINWLDDAKGTRNLKGDKHKRVFFTSAKQIAVSNSLLDNFEVSTKKAALGIKSPDTRADDTGICVNFEGKFIFAPNNSIVEASTIEAYEDAYTKMLVACAATNEPFVSSSIEDKSYLKSDPATAQILELNKTISSFRTCALVSNWDLNICGSVETENPARLTTVGIAGATKANVVGKADLLRSPITESMMGFLGKKEITPVNLHEIDSCHYMSAIYAYLRNNGKIKDLDEYLQAANRAVSPNKNRLQQGDFEYGIYARMGAAFSLMMSKDCMNIGASHVNPNASGPTNLQLSSILNSLTYLGVSQQDYEPKYKDFVTEFNRFSVFFRIWSSILTISSSRWLDDYERNKANTNQTQYQGLDSSEYFIDPYSSVHLYQPMSEKYVVGSAFSQICKDMLEYLNTPKNIVLTHDKNAPKPHMGQFPQLPTFVKICENLGPFLSTFGNVIPNAEDILAEADLESKKFVLDENTVVAPIPGMKGEFHAQKHQHKALQLLENEPRAAILDISPGGGKTIIGLVECLQLMGKGKVKLPLFVAPSKLIKNWIQDLNKEVTDFKFNSIPINGYTLKKWGEEKLSEMIRNAPPNTIFHTDTLFIKDHTKKATMNMLSNTVEIYSNLEWMKQFDWDYILFDESHTMKNAKGADGGSVQSRLFGELTLRESVKFIRLASGTIIHKDMDDIIGQTRLFDPLIFRTQKEFEKKYSIEKEPKNWSPDAPQRIREHMGRFCAVARAKNKDWAYALPEQKRKASSEWLVEFDPKFKEVYEHIIAKTIEEMGEDQELADLLKSSKLSANGDLDDDALDAMGDVEEGDDVSLSGKYNVYLSRLEQFLICPENDPLNGWNGLDFSKLKAPKMDRLVKILDTHLAIPNSGKVIIFVRHLSSIDGVFNRLPARLMSKATKYSSTDTEGLVEFETEAKIRIIIGMEQSMNTGINLQMADRIIRLEIPWAAGDVEQGFARAFRPDFHNKYNRAFIYDDWIIVNDSLEIPKLCRLISSTIRKVQFDEYGSENKDYMALNYLKSMSLNLKKFMNPDVAVRRYDQVDEYFTEYDTLARIQNAELQQERDRYIDPVTGKMGAINPYVTIPKGAELPDAKILPFTPMLKHQSFAKDIDDDKLSPFHLWLAEHKKYQKNTSLIADDKILAFCEFGYGYIVEIGRTRLDNVPPKVVIRTNNGALIEAPTDSLYIVGRKPVLSDENIKKYIGRNNKATRLDKYMCPDPRDTEGLIYRDSSGEFFEYSKGKFDRKLSASSQTPTVTPVVVAPVATTKINPALPVVAPPKIGIKNPRGAAMTETDITTKPANPINRLREKLAEKLAKQKEAEKPASYVPEDTGSDGEIVGSLCVISDSLYLTFNARDPDTEILRSLKFNRVKPFVGIEVKNIVEFNATLFFIENRFKLVNPEGIYELRNRFHKKTKMFAGEYQQTDNKFLMLNYKPIKDEKSLKLYYIVEDGKLYLVFNAEAHPKATTALLAKKPKGVADRFKKYSSTLMRSVLTKRGAISIINQVNEKAKIKNYAELAEDVANLTLV